jgi:hypothetical protein
MAVLNNLQVNALEHATEQHFCKEFAITQKVATDTYLRLTYHNAGAAGASGVVRPNLIWLPRSSGSHVIPA